MKDLITQAAASVFTGQNVIGISLPVRIFEGKSMLERLGDWYGFAPIYLKKAAQITDPLERFKLCITFAVAGLYTST